MPMLKLENQVPRNSMRKTAVVSQTVSKENTNPNKTKFQTPKNSQQRFIEKASFQVLSQISNTRDKQINLLSPNVYPLVQTLEGENCWLKKQINQIIVQLKRLKEVSVVIDEQNEKMRHLYLKRTNDLRQLVQTVIIQSQENMNDYQHQAFLQKQEKNLYLKRLEQLKSQLQAIDAINQSLQQEVLTHEQHRVVLVQEKIQPINARKESNYSESKLSQLQLQNQSLIFEVHQVENQVDELLEETTQLGGNNKKNIQRLIKTGSQNQQEKQQLNEEILRASQLIGALKVQQEELSSVADKQTLKVAKLGNKNDETKVLVKKAQVLEQRLLRQNQTAIDQSLRLRNKHNQLLKRLRERQIEKHELEEERQKLQTLLKRKKESSVYKQKEYLQQKEKAKHRHHSALTRNVLQTHHIISDQETENTAQVKDKSQLQNQIEQTETHFNDLAAQVQAYAQKLNQIDNPIFEIMQLERKLAGLLKQGI